MSLPQFLSRLFICGNLPAIPGSTVAMRPIPLLDTNVFSDAVTGKITPREWALLKKVRPRTGWPLSAITSMELLAGLHTANEENFEKARDAIVIALELSSGRILKEPRALVCEQLLRREFPDTQLRPEVLSNYLLVASRAKNKREIVERNVFIRRYTRRVRRYGGFDPIVVSDLMSGPKEKWVETLENILTGVTPLWRERIPDGKLYLLDDEREKLKETNVWVRKRNDFLRAFTEWLSPGLAEEEMHRIDEKMDAVLTFAISIVREVLLRRYSFKKHASDVYDFLQLHYLALDRFVFVTGDERLRNRLSLSTQANRLLDFHAFLRISAE